MRGRATFFSMLGLGLCLAWHESAATTFRFAVPEQVANIDPQIAISASDKFMAQTLYEGLTNLSPESLEVEGAVAKQWTKGSDQRTYLFYLREEAAWSDGSLVTAADFIRGWQRALEQKANNPQAALLIEHLTSTMQHLEAEAIGDHILKVTLGYPLDYFPMLLSLPIFYPWKSAALSNGPFMRQAAGATTLIKNPYYWGRRQVMLDAIHIQVEPNPYLVFQDYIRGNLDWSGLTDLSILPSGAWEKHADRLQSAQRYYHYLTWNHDSLDLEAGLLRALSLAVDRGKLQKYVVGNAVKADVGFFPNIYKRLRPHYLLAYAPKDANLELSKAGYCRPQMSSMDCKALPQLVLQHQDNEASKKIALSLCDGWRQTLAVSCSVAIYDATLASSNSMEPLYLQLESTRVELPHIGAFLSGWLPYLDKVSLALLRRVLSEKTAKAMQPRLIQLEKAWMTKLPVIPLLEQQTVALKNAAILGFYQNSLDIHPLKYVYFKQR